MDQFLNIVTPQTQASFAKRKDAAIMGNYPTLTDINTVYGKTFAEQWLYPQITDLSMFTGAKNINEEQVESLAAVIAAEYHYLKVTELLLFFYFFKTGRYGRFYGTVDPMVITLALRDFIKERNTFIDEYERNQNSLKCELDKLSPDNMTRDEWLEIKTITAMYNSDYTVP